jgi:drug/metabolite transporter (DMT)-like permease
LRPPSPAQKGLTIALLVCIWGTTWSVIRIGLTGIPPLTGVALRFALAGVLLWGLALGMGLRGSRLRAPMALWWTHGLLTFGVSYGLVYWAEQWVPSGLAAVLFATFPLFVALLAHFFLPGERLRPAAAAGLALGFGGVALVFSEDFAALGGPRVAFAGAVMLLSPLASAVAQVAVKKWGGHVHPVPLNAGAMVLAGAVMGMLAAIVERGRPVRFTGPAVGALLYLTLLGTAVAFSLYFWLLRHMSATTLSLTAYAIPVVAMGVGAALFREPVTARVVGGAGLVIAGTALASGRWRRRTGPLPETQVPDTTLAE